MIHPSRPRRRPGPHALLLFCAGWLTAVLGGTQSLHTNALDEAIALPT
ncbi:methylmalonyl-CoA mutase family protein, partial [Pseudomonas sp.]